MAMSFVVACKSFFGMRPGTSLVEFKEEINALTNKDRREIAEGFRAAGMEIDESSIESEKAAS